MAESPQSHSAGRRPRPLSPFTSIYRWTPTMAASITHRITGMGLFFGTIFLAWWLIAAAAGPEAYETFANLAVTPLGQLILFLCALGLIYHLLSGLRHLVWDVGHGFTPAKANTWSVLIFLAAILGAAGLFWLVYSQKGFMPL